MPRKEIWKNSKLCKALGVCANSEASDLLDSADTEPLKGRQEGSRVRQTLCTVRALIKQHGECFNENKVIYYRERHMPFNPFKILPFSLNTFIILFLPLSEQVWIPSSWVSFYGYLDFQNWFKILYLWHFLLDNITVSPHPRRSQDQVPWDFWLLPQVKETKKSKHLNQFRTDSKQPPLHT